jgi:prepilin-type N-terminal cleavage/methylation domain-containing protein
MLENYRNSLNGFTFSMHHRHAFTLIELLVVIAIIAILSVVVILVLNPAQLLEQSRDSNRISDLATMTEALGVYQTDQSNVSLGSANTVYVSIPDPAATTTAGDQCQGLGLISLPAGYAYHCAATSTYRSVNGTGWIPVTFTSDSFGPPIDSLPVDPVNQSSSRLYYTYTTNGTQFEFTASMESQKYGLAGPSDVVTADGGTNAYLYEKGPNQVLEPIDYGSASGLVGYWPLNEGTGTVAYDYSGNNATGSWSGTQVGSSGYYSAGKLEPWAGSFDGNTDVVNGPSVTLSSAGSPFTMSAWINLNSAATSTRYFVMAANVGGVYPDMEVQGFVLYLNEGGVGTACYGGTVPTSTWTFIAVTWNGSACNIFLNGTSVNSGTPSFSWSGTGSIHVGAGSALSHPFYGFISDGRFYNQALSAAQIAALYAGGK